MSLKSSFDMLRRSPMLDSGAAIEAAGPAAFIIMERSDKLRMKRAFLDEADAKRYLTRVKKNNANFANPPAVYIKKVDLH